MSLFFLAALYLPYMRRLPLLFLSQLQTVELVKTSMEACLVAGCHRNCQLVAQLASVASCMGETCRKLKCKASGGVGKPQWKKACMADQIMQVGANRIGLLGLVMSHEIGLLARSIGHSGSNKDKNDKNKKTWNNINDMILNKMTLEHKNI